MTPDEFIAKWKKANLSERSASQQHFLDLCELLGQPKPAEADPEGEFYTFERGAKKSGGGDGWADVWMRGHFAWEYKGKRKDLDAAYQQLNEYREDLENPPLLVVCDMDRFQVHTNFTGTAKRVYEFNPVLEPLNSIQRMDAIVDLSDAKNPSEPDWPESDVIVGNPPFLGGKLLRKNLGNQYVDAMFEVWKGRVPREADLCCYWFEKACALVKRGTVRRAGLLATQGIRGGANREVLDRIKESGNIFFAVSDREWVLEGANVHVSMVGFDDGSVVNRTLDGKDVEVINADLTSGVDVTGSPVLQANLGIAFMGDSKGGEFEVPGDVASQWVRSANPHGRPNSEVLRPWVNGSDVLGRIRGMWIVDFGCDMPLQEAACFEEPFKHVRSSVKPERDQNNRAVYKEKWWIHVEPRPAMRTALRPLKRYVGTTRHAKYRVFMWLSADTLPDSALIVFAREDDYFFGVLHSTMHERWALRKGTALEDRPRYTPTSCFETFPFPALADGISRETSDEPALAMRHRIAAAAKRLNLLRENWLNPKQTDGSMAVTDSELKRRTLTNLYNERPTWLELVHLELDRAVLAAYGWPEIWAEGVQPRRDASGRVSPTAGVLNPEVEQELLARLLKLNQEQAAAKR